MPGVSFSNCLTGDSSSSRISSATPLANCLTTILRIRYDLQKETLSENFWNLALGK